MRQMKERRKGGRRRKRKRRRRRSRRRRSRLPHPSMRRRGIHLSQIYPRCSMR